MSDWTLAGKAALIVVHMQHAICKTPSPLEVLGHGRAAEEDGIVPRIADLLAAFRAKELPVVFMVAYTPDDARFPAYGGFWPGVQQSGANKLGTWDVEVIEELAPADGERVIPNWPFDIFRQTDLEQHLADLEVDTVVLVGVATGMSVGTAAFQLADRAFNLIVPSDAVTDGNRQLHEAIMAGMIPAIALVTTSDDVIAHL